MNNLYDTNQVFEMLELRLKFLKELHKQKTQAIKASPDGKLHSFAKQKKGQSNRKDCYVYYLRNSPSQKTGTYLKKREKELIYKLAQKEYDINLISAIEKEIIAIEQFLKRNSVRNLYKPFDSLSAGKQILLQPDIVTQDAFINNWLNDDYEKMGFKDGTPIYTTRNKERVRSKSEVIIANILAEYKIPYKYEKRLFLDDEVSTLPDFTTLNVRKRKIFYWEHFGMMDDLNYSENALKKIDLYSANGFFPGENMIYTFESKDKPLNTEVIEKTIKTYLL